jgi:sugar-specific transcriptional regulator TrmB
MSYADLPAAKRREMDEVLSRFGLGESDRAAYLALLPLGEATLSPISRASGLRLTTAQSVMARLADLGLVRVSLRRSRHVYEALDPSVLRKILERQAEELAGIIPDLKKLKSDVAVAPRIRVFDRERMTDVFHQALGARSKLVHEIVAAKDLQDVLGERFHFTRRRVAAGVRLRSLRVESREIKRYSAAVHARELREAKFLPRELAFRCSIMFWDDTVAFFTTKDEGLAWTVRSRAARETWAQLFELLWSVGRKMETAPERK